MKYFHSYFSYQKNGTIKLLGFIILDWKTHYLTQRACVLENMSVLVNEVIVSVNHKY